MRRLGVNIDHVATIRQARATPYPDIIEAARAARRGGADIITVHLREDRRHIQDGDVRALVSSIDAPLNLEMAAVGSIAEIACMVRPATATIVPERRLELTTEGGLNVRDNRALPGVMGMLKAAGIRVSLFIDPDVDDVRSSHDLGADAVELHTGAYCNETGTDDTLREVDRIGRAASAAASLGLDIAAGHGLHYGNTGMLIRHVPVITEYNIGHAIVARAVFVGLEHAVRDMKTILEAV